jgi:Ca2+-binding RTX toxin-like protein
MTRHAHTSLRRPDSTRRISRLASAALAAGALVLGTTVAATSLTFPGTPGKDVHVGGDNDNADNPFIQPPGVAAKQHMDNTDVLFGRGNDDLLIGKLGDDTLLGGADSDILVGGPEKGSQPNSDVLLGDAGPDINIWAPGDGSDAFIGHQGQDSMIFAPFVEKANGELLLTRADGRRIPRVDIDEQPAFSCTIVDVPASQNLGFEFLVRFNVNGTPVVTVRQRDVESVYCPSPDAGRALVADLTDHAPEFRSVRLHRVPGAVGDILEPVG